MSEEGAQPMDIEEVRRHIHDWVKNTLSVPSPVFNDLPPCPYSREALAKNKVDIRCVQGASMLAAIAEIGKTWDDSYALILSACEPETIAAEELTSGIAALNRAFEGADLISFCDHPRCTDAKYKVTSANGKYVLVGVQRLSNFIEAARPLYKRKYFEGVNKQFSVSKNISKLG
jgi:hypothetical protein